MEVFVFGSNLKGIHGRGAAKKAYVHHGATMYQGEGLSGESYALPTKLSPWKSLSLEAVAEHVYLFLVHAKNHPENTYKVTRVGCGLAGFVDADIAPLFRGAPKNCVFSDLWEKYLGSEYTYFEEY